MTYRLNGIINVLKPPGMTSSDVVVFLRRSLAVKKVGHTGTLDPEAAGVLPICLGKATKIADYIMHQNKVYRCEMKLGVETVTSDMTGKIISTSDNFPNLTKIIDALNQFLGEIDQKPPMYSAIKVDGKKLYELARQGIELDIPPRRINIFSLTLLSFNPPDTVLFEVVCSKGTYIRSLCRDIGRYLGCGATMSFLLRTKTGSFFVQDSNTLDEILLAAKQGTLEKIILPIDTALQAVMPSIILRHDCLEKVSQGNRVSIDLVINNISEIEQGQNCSIFCDDTFMGIGYYAVEEKIGYIQMKNVLR